MFLLIGTYIRRISLVRLAPRENYGELLEGCAKEKDGARPVHLVTSRNEGQECRPKEQEQKERGQKVRESAQTNTAPNPPFHRIAARLRF